MSEPNPLKHARPDLFNTPLEAGLRAVVLLDAFAPEAFDLTALSLLDYYAVHTGDLDIEGVRTSSDADQPSSIHPPVASRRGEYFVRRHLIEEGLEIMERAFLLDRVADENGLSYRARDVTAAMVDLMESEYNSQLRRAARWLAHVAEVEGRDAFIQRLILGVNRWTHEIDGEVRV